MALTYAAVRRSTFFFRAVAITYSVADDIIYYKPA